ncbi:MAG TPA: hypothetical protein VM032_18415 [Vicinamibacterales bacterium]|nr:hypothetical protein [Vicinamibacterales bacterium]
MRPVPSSRASLWYAVLLIALFAYLFAARTRGVPESFLLLRDQIRDWRIALGPFSALPLVGPQSTAGGASLGPIYYWVLWLSRVLIGPAVHDLPHAGAYGISALQGAVDLVLLDTLRRRTGSLLVALGAVLLAATTSHDLAVSATIWNPAVSVAFVKLAIALRLRRDHTGSLWWTAAATAASWLAVQAHSAAIFVALPLTASYVIGDLKHRRVAASFQQARTIVEVIVLLQVPFLVHTLSRSADAAPTRALGGAAELIAAGSLRWSASAQSLLTAVPSILMAPWRTGPWAPILAVLLLVALVRVRRDLPLLASTVAPLACAVAGLSLWRGGYDEYWYLPVVPCAALSLVLALTWWRTAPAAAALLLAVVAVQPARLAHSLTWYRMPEYGPLSRGTQRIIRQTTELRRLETTFTMPPFSDAGFPFEAMGGRFSDAATFDAVIDDRGEVQFRRVDR